MIEFPRSALLMLNKGGRTKLSDMQVEYCHGEGSLKVNILVMHVQAYSMDEIFEKKLYFLIPFYAMRFKRKIRQIIRDSENTLETKAKYDKIILELKVFADRLYGLDSDRREGMVNTMGGKVLKLQAEIWMEEGMEIEKINTDREKKRADEAEQRADEAEIKLDEALREIERLKAAAN